MGETELQICDYGIEQCLSSHYYGPAIREYYLIHFIISGKGMYQYKDKKYTVRSGQGFLICPGHITFYQADVDDPWHYIWLGFRGSQATEFLCASGLSIENPIIDYESEIYSGRLAAYVKGIPEVFSWKTGRNHHLLGSLYLIFAALNEFNPAKQTSTEHLSGPEFYVRQAVEFIQMNYSRRCSISDLARKIGLERSYFGALFRQHIGISPQQFLIRLRMEKACYLLKNNELAVAAVAHSVGYSDPLLFSKMFSKVIGHSPSAYRKRIESELV